MNTYEERGREGEREGERRPYKRTAISGPGPWFWMRPQVWDAYQGLTGSPLTPLSYCVQVVVLMDPGEDPEDTLRAHRSRERTFIFDTVFDQHASQVLTTHSASNPRSTLGPGAGMSHLRPPIRLFLIHKGGCGRKPIPGTKRMWSSCGHGSLCPRCLHWGLLLSLFLHCTCYRDTQAVGQGKTEHACTSHCNMVASRALSKEGH